jgi:hypothetical protein
MDTRLFAEKYRLKTKRDECGERIMPGRVGQIYEYGAGRFGCMVMASSARYWNAARRKLVTAGCQVIQNGDTEGTALFDPEDANQVKVATQVVRAKRKRVLSESQRAALMGRLRKSPEDAVRTDVRFISLEVASGMGFRSQISIGEARWLPQHQKPTVARKGVAKRQPWAWEG